MVQCKPEERMTSLSIEEIEAYFVRRKQQNAANGSNGASPNDDAMLTKN